MDSERNCRQREGEYSRGCQAHQGWRQNDWQLGPSEGHHIDGKVRELTERSQAQGLSEGLIGGVTQVNTVISDHKNDHVTGSMSGSLGVEGTEYKTATRCRGGGSAGKA